MHFHFDHFYSFITYSGCLEGYPPLDSAMGHVKDQVKKLWGERATCIIPPSLREVPSFPRREEPTQVLPKWTHMAWCSSSAMNPENDGSELVIIWFSKEPFVNIDSIINSVDWSAHAQDYQI